ncbi:hypothetical protein CFOL_v3_05833, partial [Cephalotus follicularis]
SQGTITAFAALTQPYIAKMVEAPALLTPISFLEHVSARLVLRMVSMHLDQIVVSMGIHQLNFRSDVLISLVDDMCDGHVDCSDLLTSITGFLSLSLSLSLCVLIRKGTFSQYDYGMLKNLKLYGQPKPPVFDLNSIPKLLPLWMGYGGNDALADVKDVQHTLKELQSEPQLLYVDNYGHIDFLMSIKAKEDVYEDMVGFFRSLGKSNS